MLSRGFRNTHTTTPARDTRCGALIIELLLAVLILLLCTLGVVQWTFTAFAIQAINSASTEGARTAAGVFATPAARDAGVEATVLAVLKPLGFKGAGMTITGMTITVVDSTDHFHVEVTIPITSCPIPQLLNSFGFTAITGKSLNSTGVAWAS